MEENHVKEVSVVVEIKRVTYENEDLEARIRKSLKNPAEGERLEVACYPMTEGCCIKKGASD